MQWRSRFVASAPTAGGVTAGGVAVAERKPARTGQRIPHRAQCRVTFYDPQSGQPTTLVGQTVNISRRGLAVHLARDVPRGIWLEALVPHLDGHPTFFCGTVAHSRRVLADVYEIGIRFDGQSPPSVF